MIELIIFDFDGTLFDTRQDIADAVNHARRHFKLPTFSLDEVTGMVGHGVEVLSEKAFAGTPVPAAEALPVIMEYYRKHPGDKSRLYPGVREVLRKLSPPLAIVSNKPVALVNQMLEEHALDRFFDFVAGGDTFEKKKPSPVGIDFLSSRYNVTPSRILVVGDHSPDIEMARSSGARSVFCRYGFFKEDTTGADYQIDRFEELLTILERLGLDRDDA